MQVIHTKMLPFTNSSHRPIQRFFRGYTVTLPAHGSKSNQGRFFPCEGSVMVGALTLFLDILGGWLKWPQGGLRGVGEKIFSLKGALNLDNSNNTIFSIIAHRNDKLFNFLTFPWMSRSWKNWIQSWYCFWDITHNALCEFPKLDKCAGPPLGQNH